MRRSKLFSWASILVSAVAVARASGDVLTEEDFRVGGRKPFDALLAVR